MHIRKHCLIATLFLCTFPAFSQAVDEALAQTMQKLEGTVYVIPHRETADGVLTGCGLEFSAMKRDFSTKRGAPVRLVGSIYLRPHPNTGIAYMLKLGAYDGISNANGFAPNNAFIRAPNGKVPKKAIRIPAENPGFALFIGPLDSDVTAAFSAIAEKNELVVGFNRKPGQQDVAFTLDLTVVDMQVKDNEVIRKKSSEPVDVFMACSSELFASAKELLR